MLGRALDFKMVGRRVRGGRPQVAWIRQVEEEVKIIG